MQWRAWLERNHARASEVWLIFHKRHTGAPTLTYNDAIEEALCFGWIDGVRRSLDERRYKHRMSPIKSGSRWSERNKARAQRMLDAGLMTPAGLRAIDEAQAERTLVFTGASAASRFDAGRIRIASEAEQEGCRGILLAGTIAQSQYNDWIASAKREETRARRLAEALKLLTAGEKLGMR